ncbi:RDD family protein [Metabacillus halosaccharovorans]|uniref:RDD family protein n=1 Tax=Metabacillus halosaccharovorans TaxID=930124 RepID=UPI0034CF8F8D
MDSTFEGPEQNESVEQMPVDKKSIVHYPNMLAGFWVRFWAYLVDLLVIGSVNRIIIYPLFSFIGLDTSDSFIFSPVSIATAITYFAYFVFMTKFLNQTLGKMIFGLRVVSNDDTSLNWSTIIFRELVGRYISKMIWIGFLIAAFTPKKQTLHDIFADTLVIHEKVFSKAVKEETIYTTSPSEI